MGGRGSTARAKQSRYGSRLPVRSFPPVGEATMRRPCAIRAPRARRPRRGARRSFRDAHLLAKRLDFIEQCARFGQAASSRGVVRAAPLVDGALQLERAYVPSNLLAAR